MRCLLLRLQARNATSCVTPRSKPTLPARAARSAGCLSELLPYGPHTAEHCILSAGLQPGRVLGSAPLSADERGALLGGVRAWEAWLDACEDSDTPPGGVILTGRPKGGKAAAAAAVPGDEPAGEQPGSAADEAAKGVYEEFEPVLLRQHEGRPCLSFPTFDAALAEFFGKAAGQRAAAAAAQREKAAVGKLEAIRRDHEKRLGSLGVEAEAAQLKVGPAGGRRAAWDAEGNGSTRAVVHSGCLPPGAPSVQPSMPLKPTFKPLSLYLILNPGLPD